MKSTLACLAGVVLLSTRMAPGAEPIDYVKDIKPLLAKHCVSCHEVKKPRGGLRLDTAQGALDGGDSGPAVVPRQIEESLLIEAVVGGGEIERMPLKRPPLSDQEIALLKAWINQGARAPSDEVPSQVDFRHWAFVPPVRPELPKVSNHAWSQNPIDRFVFDRLDRSGLAPSPEADRKTLLRRVTLDLTGLLPTLEEVDQFVADPRPDAYERVVDRLLGSPHYGERWARPWLDLARYADSNGYSIDAPRSIWKYRDWVINALNQDLPFDQFTIDQLAGDLRPNATLEQKVATGFHRNTPINQEGGIDLEQFRVDSVFDRVATTATTFLGLTLACAQCHDHKFDPLSQREYYEFFAFFNNVDEPDMEFVTPEDLKKREDVRKRVAAFHSQLAKDQPDLPERVRAWESTLDPAIKVAQPAPLKAAFDKAPEVRTPGQKQLVLELFLAKVKDPDVKALYRKLAAIKRAEPKPITTMVVRERAKPRVTTIMLGGDFTRAGEPVSPGVPKILPALPSTPTAKSNRLDLARWLVSRENPLTARVTVNRIWQAYFGLGLVETENDFGTQGTPPSHPELLDWLATEFVDGGWSMKAIHRQIVTSMTYRQSSAARSDAEAIDPANRLLARQGRLRLDAEMIRDVALSATGLLTPVVGGPSVFPPQPDGVMNQGQMRRAWTADEGPNRYRRGLYTYFWRATPHPSLIVFDAPNAVQACSRRIRSNTPLQALMLLNDESAYEFAQALARRLLREAPTSDDRRIDLAFRLCLSRLPSNLERSRLKQVLAEERFEGISGPDRRDELTAATDPVDRVRNWSQVDLAAWTTLSRVLLNLDEFITRE